MRETNTAAIWPLPKAGGAPADADRSQHVSAAVATVPGGSQQPTIELFQTLAAIPVRRTSVAGAAPPKPDGRHVMGGVHVTTGGARRVPVTPGGAAVLHDGTCITFSSVQQVLEPEPV